MKNYIDAFAFLSHPLTKNLNLLLSR